jgi:hypothetical protein
MASHRPAPSSTSQHPAASNNEIGQHLQEPATHDVMIQGLSLDLQTVLATYVELPTESV